MTDISAVLEVGDIVIGEQTYEFLLKEHLKISGDLNAEFATHAEKFAWYATALELAQDWQNRIKLLLDRAYAYEDYKARGELSKAHQKFTEKMIENTVITQESYVKLQNAFLEAQKVTGLLKAARDAMIHKRDMLVGMGANYRAEGNSHLVLKGSLDTSAANGLMDYMKTIKSTNDKLGE